MTDEQNPTAEELLYELRRARKGEALPQPAFHLKWRESEARYVVDEPNIGDTDVYTADQMRAAFRAGQQAASLATNGSDGPDGVGSSLSRNGTKEGESDRRGIARVYLVPTVGYSEGAEGTHRCTCADYPHRPWCGRWSVLADEANLHPGAEQAEWVAPSPAAPLVAEDGWRDIASAPLDGEFLACIQVTHGAGKGPTLWHQHVLMLDDESGGIHHDYHQGWELDDYAGWMPLPAPPAGGGESGHE